MRLSFANLICALALHGFFAFLLPLRASESQHPNIVFIFSDDLTCQSINTVVICSSDQGFFLGEHGWFDKRWIFEESLRTPLLVRWPGVTKPGSVNNDIVSLIDFAETFLDVAGIDSQPQMQGWSMVPLMNGNTPSDWRKSLYYHYYEFPEPHRIRPHYGVITDRFKLIHYYKPDVDDWELLDREKDPHEIKNVYSDPTYADVVRQLHTELDRLRKEVNDTGAVPRSAYGNQRF